MERGQLLGAIFLAAVVLPAAGETGQKDYEMFCGACHNPDGKGAGEGAFPPLAGSEWVRGDAERMVQLVLHGLEGPVSVAGKSFDLVMPPQGAALSDEQIARIVSYVRTSWGHTEEPIEASFVKAARGRSADRKTMWKAPELLKRWPLPHDSGPIQDLVAHVYKGKFTTMPDFSKLKVAAVEEEAAGLLDLSTLGEKQHFAVVWEGVLNIAEKGEYFFRLDSDDGSRLFIDGRKIAEVKGTGPMGRAKQGKLWLKPGPVKIRVEYFEFEGQEGISLAMMLKNQWTQLSATKSVEEKVIPSLPIVVTDEARIYRNFIKGSGARAIGVGYPGGVNLAFDADDLGIPLVWQGAFMDGGLHWTARGKGFQPPAGEQVQALATGPAFAYRGEETTPWPRQWQEELKPRFRGYVLDERRRPEFRYEVAGLSIRDKAMEGDAGELRREISLRAGEEPPANLSLRLSGPGARSLGSHRFAIGPGGQIVLESGDLGEPVVTREGVVLPLNLQPGENRLRVSYQWK
ncbi:c-type cytochrome [Roseibacillus ishigakijimensis]|uniref:C-type cytochrome n=1 Tax=Roseibacillus ishigakijimensis TaxID=454146 RepID=A0A934RPH0_9BACT|nr:c-type cytochrome [Roseibacillus ishigakijimensis]MBK1834580.1 c-type cytochrome [Roseibacillus ishigakijimensis]